ncbi:MAG: DUF5906 domain-containing protein [Methylobacter sp.]
MVNRCFFEILNGVLGTENISNYSLESLTDDKGYHRAMIKGKIVNYGTDIRLNKIDAAIFKQLASGEPVEARAPFKPPFIMTDYAKLIFNVNKVDSFNVEHTPGFHRRLLIVPFAQFISEDQQDRDFHKKVLEDRAGILNWIIEGAEQVVKNRDIIVSEECKACKDKFITEADSVAMYEMDVKETMRGPVYSKTVAEAYSSYRDFCHEAGHTRPLRRTNFVARMEARGFMKVKKDRGICLEKKYTDESLLKNIKQQVKKISRY